jgi:hypothetical protein
VFEGIRLASGIRGWSSGGAILVGAALLSVPASVHAEDNNIKVTIVAVLASSRHQRIDPRLKELAVELKKKNPKWTGFEVERTLCESIKIGAKATVKIMDDYRVTVTIKGRDPDTGCVSFIVKPDTLDEFAYTCCCHKFFPVITRYDTKDKDRLVIAFMAKPCMKK